MIDRRNGDIWLYVKNRNQGFEGLSCEFEGKKSTNKITLHAISNPALTVTPNEFKIGLPIDMQCTIDSAPLKNSKYYAHLVHRDAQNKDTTVVRFDHNYETNVHDSTFVDYDKTIWDITLGKEDTKLYARMSPLNARARGRYYCQIFFYGTHLNAQYNTAWWNTDDHQVVDTTTTMVTSSDAPITETTPTPNSAFNWNSSLLFTITSVFCTLIFV